MVGAEVTALAVLIAANAILRHGRDIITVGRE